MTQLNYIIKPIPKQKLCWKYLRDSKTRFILFGGGAGGCFGKDTLIKTINGYKHIIDIKIGDKVLSFDDKSKQLVYNKVTNKFIYENYKNKLLKIIYNNKPIIVTENHKFLFNNQWTPIKEILEKRINESQSIQDTYLTKDKLGNWKKINEKIGNTINLNSIDSWEEIKKETVYDLEVENTHNYTITKNNIIVHNSKSWLGCEWLIFNCLMYKETKWFLARNQLKRIMASTYITFLKVTKERKLPRELWKLNSQYNYIEFYNGSRIDLLDVAYMPSDPLYERFGSTEYTGGWMEEIGEIKEKAFDVLKSRIGRQLNNEYCLFPKIFLTCNPKKHWAYHSFYKPWKEGTLPDDCVFIQSLYTDNPYTKEQYGQMLAQIKDKAMKERLMYGNWEYDDDSGALMEYDKILAMFEKEPTFTTNDQMYLSIDVARFGKDKAVFILWQNLHIRKIWYYDKSSLKYLDEKTISLCNQYQVPFENVIVDQDGMGGSIIDHVPGTFAFVNGGRAIEELDDNKKYRLQDTDRYSYKNLRSQCYFKLADYINENKITISKDIDQEVKNWIIQELEAIRKKDVEDNEKKLQIIGKEEIKDSIGRSPDFSDAMMQRMYYELGVSGNMEVAIEW